MEIKKIFKIGALEEEGEEKKEDQPAVPPSEILNNLKDRLKEFYEILPKLNERREGLEDDIDKIKEKILEIDQILPKLEERKRNLQDELEKVQKELLAIDEISDILKKIG